MNKIVHNRAASVRQRLLDKARARQDDYQMLLDRYAIERLLYRLSVSKFRGQFLLKGALLFNVWFDHPHRPTRDADFLAFGEPDAARIEAVLREVCAIEADDGLVYNMQGLTIEPIREHAKYVGLRANFFATIGGARCIIQLDFGFGDAVTPAAVESLFPTLLDGYAGATAENLTARGNLRREARCDSATRHNKQSDEGLFRFVGVGARR
jgi:hypothetical protein